MRLLLQIWTGTIKLIASQYHITIIIFVNIGPAVFLGTERSPVVGAPPLITEWSKPDHLGSIHDNSIS